MKHVAHYEFWNKATLFQDPYGRSPVTDVGQRVMLVKDQSGNGFNLQQTSEEEAPCVDHRGVVFAGRSMLLMTKLNRRLAERQSLKLSARLRVETSARTGVVFEMLGATENKNGGFGLFMPSFNGDLPIELRVKGDGPYVSATTSNTLLDFTETMRDVVGIIDRKSFPSLHVDGMKISGSDPFVMENGFTVDGWAVGARSDNSLNFCGVIDTLSLT